MKRGVPCVRYADDIVLLAKSRRASERLLESSTKYLEGKLKLTVNREKSLTTTISESKKIKTTTEISYTQGGEASIAKVEFFSVSL